MSNGTTLLKKWELLQAITADPALSLVAKVIAARLLDHHNNQTGQCSPAYETLARGAGLERRSAIRAVKELEGAGWLRVHRVSGGASDAAKGFVTNSFVIDFSRADRVAPPVTDQTLPPSVQPDTPPSASSDTPLGDWLDTPPGDSPDTPGVTNQSPPGVSDQSPKHLKLETGKGNRESPPTPSRFDEWWETYPRRDGKIAARKVYDRTIKQGLGSHDELMAGARRYADARAGQDPKFTKLPTTWLNGGHWADEHQPQHQPAHNPTSRPDAGRPSATAYLMARQARRLGHG